MRERDVERAVVRKWPWKSFKLAGPGEVGKPDRMFLGPGGFVAFIEFKAPGEEPTKKQADTIAELRESGHRVNWFDDADEAIEWLRDSWKRGASGAQLAKMGVNIQSNNYPG